jgi:uncharacterized protein with PIN domain
MPREFKKCIFCKGDLEFVEGEHKARWIDTIIVVPDAKYYRCQKCGRTKFTPDEGLRLQGLAQKALGEGK